MKKDPMTQTSMSSFILASAIKREPEDNDNADQITQNSKRRRVEDEQVVVKSEPMDTESATQSNFRHSGIKDEPPDDDSDAQTEAGSDDEEMYTPMENRNEVPVNHNPPFTSNVTSNAAFHIKQEPEHSTDEDTDKESDDERSTVPTVPSTRNSIPPTRTQFQKQANNERKIGANESQSQRQPVEQRPIKSEPVTTHEST